MMKDNKMFNKSFFSLPLKTVYALSASTALLTNLVSCSQAPSPVSTASQETDAELIDKAAADIGDLTQNGVSITSIMTPAGYKRGDKLLAYEGPGWESNKVGYRLYLDGRNALDIYGKKTTDMVLSRVGRGDDYHAMADWGMDILKVGNSLGAGGFGIYKDGNVVQIGDAERYKAAVLEDTPATARLEVSHIGSQNCGSDIQAQYIINADARMTKVKVSGDCNYPIAAGLIIHPNTKSLASKTNEGWQYKARYGSQSLVPDNLGLALFYQSADVAQTGTDDDDDYIVFKTRDNIEYYTAAAWAQELGGLSTEQDFENWLKSTQKDLNANRK
jgi:hypothetical protein